MAQGTPDQPRRSAEQQLHEREEQYRRIFEATTDGLVINDLDTGAVAEVNPAYCRMHGYEYEEMIGRSPTNWIHPEDHHLFAEYLEAISAGREFRSRARQIHRDGTVFHVEVHGTPFLFRGRPHVLGLLRDISNEVETTRVLEQRVAERTHELSSLLSFANQAAATRELHQLVAVVLPEVERMLGCSWSAVYVKDGDGLESVGGAASPRLRRPLPERWASVGADEMLRGEGDLAGVFPSDVAASCSLVVPLVTSGETIGILCLATPRGRPFQDEHLALARGVGDQLSVAISNARYFQASQQTAAQEERDRIARDLHDSVSQSLFSLTLHARTAELALARAGLDSEGEVGRSLQRVRALTQAALAEMRALIFELRPGALGEEGLGAALLKHSAAVTAREGLEIRVSAPGERLPLVAGQEEHLYRLAQEALNNVVKHAHANCAWVELTSRARVVVLVVRDDGVGFDPDDAHPGHLGLATMRDRAAQIGAELSFESEAGAGTTVQVLVPAGEDRSGR